VRAEVAVHLAKRPSLPKTNQPCLLGVAGTVTTLAAMAQDLRSYDPALFHGYRLTLPALEEQIDRPARLDPKASAKPWLVSTPFAPT